MKPVGHILGSQAGFQRKRVDGRAWQSEAFAVPTDKLR